MAKTEKSCIVCTKMFTGNAHKTTCSPACRTKLSRMKLKGEVKPKIQVQDLTEQTHVVKPITSEKKKTNISLSQMLKDLGYQPATEPKKFIPPILKTTN